MRKFLIIVEKSETGFGAYSPDLPGCVAVGDTQEEAEQKIYEAIHFHLEGLQTEGLAIPTSQSVAEYMLVPELAEIEV